MDNESFARKETMAEKPQESFLNFYTEIKNVLLTSRNQAYHAVNFSMVQAYWNVGRIIVEHEQAGNFRAEYGKGVLQRLSEELTREFGKGFDVRNLQQMKSFIPFSQIRTQCVRN